VKDQNKLAEVTKECMDLAVQGKDANTEKCKNAAEAQKQVAEAMAKDMMKQLQQ
jgi:hypothetical protein